MKILFSDGEAIEHGDHNAQREFTLRTISDLLAANMAAPDSVIWSSDSARGISELRPLRQAGSFFHSFGGASSTVEVYGGLWLLFDSSANLGADQQIGILAHKDTSEIITGFIPASAGNWRRDIIQARVTYADDPNEIRDFKDAITGALSTISLVKTSRAVVEYARKAGLEHASSALASDAATEQSADAGWFKIGSVLVDDNALASFIANAWDWRKPWGYSTGQTHVEDFGYGNTHTINFEREQITGDIEQIVAGCPFAKNQVGCGQRNQAGNVRLERIRLLGQYTVGPPTVSDVRLVAYNLQNQNDGDSRTVTSRVTAGPTNHLLLDPSTYPSDPPLWSSGRAVPYASGSETLRLRLETKASTDEIAGIEWFGWGGF